MGLTAFHLGDENSSSTNRVALLPFLKYEGTRHTSILSLHNLSSAVQIQESKLHLVLLKIFPFNCSASAYVGQQSTHGLIQDQIPS